MAGELLLLREYPAEIVRLSCEKCGRAWRGLLFLFVAKEIECHVISP